MSYIVPMLRTISSNTFVVGILSSILGAIAVLLFQYVYREAMSARSDKSGFWEVTKTNKNNVIIKKDLMIMRCNEKAKKFTANMYGIIPCAKNGIRRTWKCEGILNGKNMLAIFYAKNTNIVSYGVGCQDHFEDDTYKGSYLRPSIGTKGTYTTHKIVSRKINDADIAKWCSDNSMKKEEVAEIIKANKPFIKRLFSRR